MDIGSRLVYGLHLGACSFTRVRCVLKKDATGGQDLGVACHIYVAAGTTILVEELGCH